MNFTEVSLFRTLYLMLFVSLSLHAKTKGNFSHTVFGTSSEYHTRAFDFSGEIDDGEALIDGRKADGYVLHKNFTMTRVTIGHKFNYKTNPSLRAGYLSRSYNQTTSSVPILSLRGEQEYSEKLFFNYHFGYVPMSEEFQTAFTVREILRGALGVIGGSYRWSEYWRSTFYLQHYYFNDQNFRVNHDVGLFYGIARGEPWIWVGLGASRMSNTQTTRGYWVPLEFYTFGPRFDVAFAIGERFRFSTGLNLNYFKDVRIGEGTGYSITDSIKRLNSILGPKVFSLSN